MKVSTQIIEVIEALCKQFGIAIDWTSENIIPYIQTLIERYANYVISTRIFGISFCLVVLLVWVVFYVIWWRCANKDGGYIDWDDIHPVVFTGVLVIIIVANLITIPILVSNMVEAIYMPEVSFIKYIQGYINNR